MKINGITDVFFDLDHTLWDFDKNSALTFDKIFKTHAVDVDLNAFLKIYQVLNLKYWKLYRDEKITKDALRFNRLNDAFVAINFDVSESLINKLSDDYIVYLTSFNHLFNYTLDVLDYLKPKYNLYIISNGFEDIQNKKLTNSNIIKYFKTITNADMVGIKKPNPEIFNHALKSANTTFRKSIMIGDSYEADILGALNVGMNAIFFDNNTVTLKENVKCISSLLQLKAYL
ncbi:YjjG family noncanonical pyrimidine nucleotidase [uncultured Algibacter sp.]|uniref:YjjG family noncanonical pyrimidine nucleotidase n=1 Tax=uncultured Algibacter sp. TaxID=298659 RepID=UPI0032175094